MRDLGLRRNRWSWLSLALVTGGLAACYGSADHDDDGGAGASGGDGSGAAATGASSSGGASDGGSSDAGGMDSSAGSSSGGTDSGGSGASSGGGSGGTSLNVTPCLTDEDCAAEGLLCEESYMVCVECTVYADCPEGTLCDRYACVPFEPCTTDEHCNSETPICHDDPTVGMHCVGCDDDNPCPDGQACRYARCTPLCSDNDDCAPLGQVCQPEGGHCAECASHADCGASEFCTSDECQQRYCTPGDSHCVDRHVVVCNDSGSGYAVEEDCGIQACTTAGGQAACDPSYPPAGALNTDGGFEEGGADWHQNGLAVQLTNGMVCTSDSTFVELGWPVDVADAALLTYLQDYTLYVRTSLTLTETYGTASLEVKVGGPTEPYVEYFSQSNVPIAEGVQDHAFTFTMEEPSGSAGIVLIFYTVAAEFCVDEIWLMPGGG